MGGFYRLVPFTGLFCETYKWYNHHFVGIWEYEIFPFKSIIL